jgi:hypothetical protein
VGLIELEGEVPDEEAEVDELCVEARRLQSLLPAACETSNTLKAKMLAAFQSKTAEVQRELALWQVYAPT